jgi:hypothetical protein
LLEAWRFVITVWRLAGCMGTHARMHEIALLLTLIHPSLPGYLAVETRKLIDLRARSFA